jgi:hypothetical protein
VKERENADPTVLREMGGDFARSVQDVDGQMWSLFLLGKLAVGGEQDVGCEKAGRVLVGIVIAS